MALRDIKWPGEEERRGALEAERDALKALPFDAIKTALEDAIHICDLSTLESGPVAIPKGEKLREAFLRGNETRKAIFESALRQLPKQE